MNSDIWTSMSEAERGVYSGILYSIESLLNKLSDYSDNMTKKYKKEEVVNE